MSSPGVARRPTRRGLVFGAVWVVMPLVIAALVTFDPWISSLAGADFWSGLRLYAFPYRTLPLIVALFGCVALALYLLRLASSFTSAALALIFLSLQLNGIGLGPLDIFDAALFGTFFAWIVCKGLDTDRAVRLSPLLWLALALLLMALAYLPALSPVTWVVGLLGITRVVVLTFLVVDLCRDWRALDAALRVFLAVATASALFGIVQFGLAYFDIYYFTLIDPPVSAFKPTPLGFVMRASGLCVTAQHFSSFLVYALPVALWRWSESRSLKNVAVCAILLAGIGSTLNFGGFFAAAFVIAAFPFLRWPSLTIHILLAGLALAALGYFTGVADLIYDLTFGDSGVAKGVSQRKTLFTLGLEQIENNPLIGTGLRGFSEVDGNFWGRPVHNIFGQAAVELGLAGVMVFLWIFFYLPVDLVRVIRAGGQGQSYAAMMFLMVVAAFQIGQSEPNLDHTNTWLVLALAQAVVLIQRNAGTGVTAPIAPTP